MWRTEEWSGHKPLPRSGCAGCSVGSRLIFFGGNACSSGENFLNDTYVFNVNKDGVTNCSELDVQGTAPFAMDRHTAIEYKDDIWVFGGDRGWTLTNKLWKFHSTPNTWTEVITQGAPCARRGHTAVKCEGRKSMIVFGGMVMTHVPYYLYGRLVTNNVSVNDTWELLLEADPPTWERRAPAKQPPPPRRGQSAVVFEPDAENPATRMYIFGGYCEQEDCPGVWYNDLWRFVVEKSDWQPVVCWGDVPAPRVGHGAARTNRDSFIIFGGGSLENNENSLYECYENGLWRRIEPLDGSIPPSPRSYVTFAVVGNRLYLHGGCNNDRELGCLHSLSLDFNALLPRSLLHLVAEFLILNNVNYKPPVKELALEAPEDPSDRPRTASRCGGRH